jgi:tripartite-type tricarboxylate transporter receptor subunit TctC
VIVNNMPGGGGRRSEVYLATAAPKDGTVISIVPDSTVLDSLEGNLPEKIDANTFAYIGRVFATDDGEVTWTTSATKTFEDAKTRETIVASSGIGDPASFIPLIMNELFGTKFKVVQGYKGTADMALAMERGEVEGTIASLPLMKTLHPEWVANKSVNFLWQNTAVRRPGFADVPSIVEFATTDDQKALLKLATSAAELGRSLAAPPGTADDVVAAYRKAFDDMIKDADFIADAGKRGLILDTASGEEVQAIVKATMESPQSAVDHLVKVVSAKQ